MLFMYMGLHFHYNGAGALASLITGLTASQLWERGWPRRLATGPDPHFAHNSEAELSVLWRTVA